MYIRYSPAETRIPIATGRFSTNFRAEAAALHTAADHIREHQDEARDQVVIFTDALSVLHALKDPRSKGLNALNSTLSDLATQVKLTLQWIPAHCGVQGNETADRLAKEGGQLDQDNYEVSFEEEKTIIKSLARKKWHQQHPNYNKQDDYYRLKREDQVILFRLRTGHNRMRAHMHNKLRIGPTEMCPCNTGPMTTQHLLQDCPTQDALRKTMWPDQPALRMQLFGCREELQRTAAFARATGVTI